MKVLLFFCFCMPEEAGIPVRVSAERKTTMEDVDTLISKALKLIDTWEEEPRTRHTAD